MENEKTSTKIARARAARRKREYISKSDTMKGGTKSSDDKGREKTQTQLIKHEAVVQNVQP